MEYVGSFGRVHRWPVEFNLHDSGLSVQLTVRRPDGSLYSRSYGPSELAAMPADAFEYTVAPGDLSVAGKYSALLELLWTSGSTPVRREFVVREFHVEPRPATATESPTPASDLLTPDFIRDTFLPGLQLVGPSGETLSPAVIQQRINAVVAAFERHYEVKLRPTRVKVGREALEGELPEHDVFYPGRDFHPDGALENRNHLMALPITPLRELHAFGLWLPGMSRASRFPLDWAFTEFRSNKIRIYPGKSLTLALPAMSGFFVNLVSIGRVVPHAWHFSYTAGYSAQDLLTTEADVLSALGKLVACEVLVPGSLDRAFAQGIQGTSLSADGLGQSFQLINSANALKYQGLITQYLRELEEWERTYWARKSGTKWGIL